MNAIMLVHGLRTVTCGLKGATTWDLFPLVVLCWIRTVTGSFGLAVRGLDHSSDQEKVTSYLEIPEMQ